MKNGDYLYQTGENGTFDICRVLRLDIKNDVVHVIVYDPVSEEPTPETLETLTILGAHAPIRASSFDGWNLLSGEDLTKQDLEGYYEYLKHNNFQAYLEETGQESEAVIEQSKEFFTQAYELHEKKEYEPAIEFYQKAYAVFPLLYEAKDNEAFCHMSLGKFENALECLHLSIQRNGNTYATDFSVGQCFFQMGENDPARKWLERAASYSEAPAEMKDAIKGIFAEMDAKEHRN